jgi:gas vesicle protein
MKLFLSGLAAGLGIGYLMAPRSGKETRDQLSQAATKQTEALKDRWSDVSAQVKQSINDLKTSSGLFKAKPNLFADMESGKLDKYLDEEAIARRKAKKRPRQVI